MSYVKSGSAHEEYHPDQSLPHGRSHFSVNIGLDTAADSPGDTDNELWPIRERVCSGVSDNHE
jgi:hypothetical protein